MSELQDRINRLVSFAKYIDIIQKHGFFDDAEVAMKETMRPFDTMSIIFDRLRYMNENNIHSKNDIDEETYDTVRFLANLMVFADTMKPISDKYNPTAEQKHKFLLYLNKEENNDEKDT